MKSLLRMLLLTGTMLALLTVGAVSVACTTDEPTESGDALEALDLDELECGAAFVDFVSIEEGDEDGGFVAVVQGFYPAACDQLGKVDQTVDGDAITIEMCSAHPPDIVCAQQLTPFVETLPIETDELVPGTYSVQVNDATIDADRIAASITIE